MVRWNAPPVDGSRVSRRPVHRWSLTCLPLTRILPRNVSTLNVKEGLIEASGSKECKLRKELVTARIAKPPNIDSIRVKPKELVSLMGQERDCAVRRSQLTGASCSVAAGHQTAPPRNSGCRRSVRCCKIWRFESDRGRKPWTPTYRPIQECR